MLSGGLRYCGVGHGYDDVFVKGNAAEQKVRHQETIFLQPTYLGAVQFIAYYGKNGKTVAVAT
jgi:hypothetical protein